jgi:hypothetical protein
MNGYQDEPPVSFEREAKNKAKFRKTQFALVVLRILLYDQL